MCGIMGYVGSRRAAPILYEGLKRLEYRGYDSCSVTTVGETLDIRKDVGRVEEVNKKLRFLEMGGETGICHNRWASVGSVSQINSHPQTDCSGRIAVAHNGTITNHKNLREELKTRQHLFKSGTDTEVIAHLIEEGMRAGKDYLLSVREALKRLEGDYAVLAIRAGDSRIVAGRRGLPLLLGVARHGFFVASDAPAFLEQTKRVVYLYEDDFAVLDKNGYRVFGKNGRRIARKEEDLKWGAEEARKGEFKHFMFKEITEQVEVLKRLSKTKKEELNPMARRIKGAKSVFLVASGTSYHACLSASYLFSRIAKVKAVPVIASELKGYERLLDKGSLVIAVSQSGETADLLGAVRLAKAKGASIYSMVNVPGSSLTRLSDGSASLKAGPEIAVASTKAYTAELGLFVLLAYHLAGDYEKGIAQIRYLWNVSYYLLSERMQIELKKMARLLWRKKDIFLIGRGEQYATALEAALKLKEVSYIHAEALPGGELKHGALALIKKGIPCICFVSPSNEGEIMNDMMQLKVRGAMIIGVSRSANSEFDHWIKVRDTFYGNPMLQILPIQILAYRIAVLKGIDPDHPRNLSKSITVS